jgi:hypothetical protein
MYNELKIFRGRTFGLGDALRSLYDGREKCFWMLRGEEYSGLEWGTDNVDPKPTEQELLTELARLRAEYDATVYQQKRKVEYPPVEDFIDAMVKGDEEQKQAYIDACLAVKAKYPKPSEV